MIANDEERSSVKAFFHVLTAIQHDFKDDFLTLYPQFTSMFRYMPPDPQHPSKFLPSSSSDLPKNRIYFGAPGTGKSHQMAEDASLQFARENIVRVTFHPDYTYAQFVGGFRPFTDTDQNSPNYLKSYYRYVPGPFINAYVQAKTTDQPVVLLIEEINRANPAGVFGDVFQLLDRNTEGISEYPVATSDELRIYLVQQHLSDADTLSLPSNLYLWATMNSADQGVFPMDTAFKRRWDFDYVDINENESSIEKMRVTLGQGSNRYQVKWNDLRHAINRLLREAHINEDKLLGPFFINPQQLEDDDTFQKAFKSKVLMYLYEDAAKLRKSKVFDDENATYSELCRTFDNKGEGVFKNMHLDHYPIPASATFTSPLGDSSVSDASSDDIYSSDGQADTQDGDSNRPENLES